ncbi:MAG: homoserine O-acetyltransferase [Phycisphaerae bacterium]
MTEFLESSDSLRTNRPLKYAQTVAFDEPLTLEKDGRLEEVTVCFETYGQLNKDASNAVLICHAVSGDSHVAAHDADDDPGWWDLLVGPGKPVDTNRYFVICPNVLGGCRGTTGPNSIDPATGKPYGANFPTITIGDMVETQRRLIDHLGIDKLLCVIGGSMGGHQALTWAVNHPDRLRSIAAVATSHRLTSQALAFDIVGRNAILHDPNFNRGEYYESPSRPDVGLAIARMIGHITYLSPAAMQQKFGADRNRPRDVDTDFEKRFSVGSYLGYQGTKFVERFDANSYLALTLAMDMFDLGDTHKQLTASLSESDLKWLVISYTSDWLFPPEQSQQIVRALLATDKPVTYCNVRSDCGHDAFLLEDEVKVYGGLMRAFLYNELDDGSGRLPVRGEDEPEASPAYVFRQHRIDYDEIISLIPESDSVLDVGCAQGRLLTQLRKHGNRKLMGVEVNESSIVACVRRGMDVIQADLNDGLPMFTDGQFDTAVLSHTLQAIGDVQKAMTELLRVGKRVIVSFPNFGYYKLREMLARDGKAPASKGLLKYRWYNTPNMRFFTIRDFEEYCDEFDIRIHRKIALDTEAEREVEDDPNLNADMAIFVLSR